MARRKFKILMSYYTERFRWDGLISNEGCFKPALLNYQSRTILALTCILVTLNEKILTVWKCGQQIRACEGYEAMFHIFRTLLELLYRDLQITFIQRSLKRWSRERRNGGVSERM